MTIHRSEPIPVSALEFIEDAARQVNAEGLGSVEVGTSPVVAPEEGMLLVNNNIYGLSVTIQGSRVTDEATSLALEDAILRQWQAKQN